MTLDKFFEAVLNRNIETKYKLNEGHEDTKEAKEYELYNNVINSINKLYEFVEGDDEKAERLLIDAIYNSDVPIYIIQGVARELTE